MKRIYRTPSLKEFKHLSKIVRNYNTFDQSSKFIIKQNLSGLVNKVYILTQDSKKFILRQSPAIKKLNHLFLEVEFLNFLKQKKFNLVPQVIKNKQNNYITTIKNRHYTLQTYLPGKVIASWDNLKKINIPRLKKFFIASAQLSKKSKNFTSKIKFENTTLFDYTKNANSKFKQLIKALPNCDGRNLVIKYKKSIEDFIAETLKELQANHYQKLPRQAVHFDFHPGNLHFIGNKVTGIFDFDWLRFDSRIAEIAGTIAQACYYFGGPKSGYYRQEYITQGLLAYRQTYGKSEFKVKEENSLIRIALKAYIIFQLIYFSLEKYKENLKNPKYYSGLKHFLKLIRLNDYEKLFSCGKNSNNF